MGGRDRADTIRGVGPRADTTRVMDRRLSGVIIDGKNLPRRRRHLHISHRKEGGVARWMFCAWRIVVWFTNMMRRVISSLPLLPGCSLCSSNSIIGFKILLTV